MKFVSLIIILSMALSSCTPATKEETAQKELRKIMEENGAVGLSVAVVKEGKIIYAGAFGEKNREEAVMLDTNHLFRIASISKSFTVTSLMQLAEKGLLSLEDDVSSLIGFQVRNPKFPDRKVSLKMLLSHTSGLRDTLDTLILTLLILIKILTTQKPGTITDPERVMTTAIWDSI